MHWSCLVMAGGVPGVEKSTQIVTRFMRKAPGEVVKKINHSVKTGIPRCKPRKSTDSWVYNNIPCLISDISLKAYRNTSPFRCATQIVYDVWYYNIICKLFDHMQGKHSLDLSINISMPWSKVGPPPGNGECFSSTPSTLTHMARVKSWMIYPYNCGWSLGMVINPFPEGIP